MWSNFDVVSNDKQVLTDCSLAANATKAWHEEQAFWRAHSCGDFEETLVRGSCGAYMERVKYHHVFLGGFLPRDVNWVELVPKEDIDWWHYVYCWCKAQSITQDFSTLWNWHGFICYDHFARLRISRPLFSAMWIRSPDNPGSHPCPKGLSLQITHIGPYTICVALVVDVHYLCFRLLWDDSGFNTRRW